jgi:TolB protein
MRFARLAILGIIGASLAAPVTWSDLPAQDRIELGITYRPGVRPGMLVVAGPGLDSVRKVVERDLQFSDRFEMAILPDSAPPLAGALNLGLYANLGLTWAVELTSVTGGVQAKLHHLPSGETRHTLVRGIERAATGDGRMRIHQLSDELQVAAVGGKGIAATRILFVLGDAIWSVDSDGANLQRVSRGTGRALSPTWSPDGRRIAYNEMRDYGGVIVLQTLASGARQIVPRPTGGGQAMTPAFSPDGSTMIYAITGENGTDLFAADIARMCCVRPLTATGKLADNQNPTYSPDGRRVAFMSTRPGRGQIYVMDADGANQRALVNFDGDGAAFSPEWSPDGDRVAFHRDIAGGRHVLVYDFGTGRATAVTSAGRNEDPSWAPDSRHLVFRSSRGGSDQLWIVDTETGSPPRQLTRVSGSARLPAWSPAIQGTNP